MGRRPCPSGPRGPAASAPRPCCLAKSSRAPGGGPCWLVWVQQCAHSGFQRPPGPDSTGLGGVPPCPGLAELPLRGPLTLTPHRVTVPTPTRPGPVCRHTILHTERTQHCSRSRPGLLFPESHVHAHGPSCRYIRVPRVHTCPCTLASGVTGRQVCVQRGPLLPTTPPDLWCPPRAPPPLPMWTDGRTHLRTGSAAAGAGGRGSSRSRGSSRWWWPPRPRRGSRPRRCPLWSWDLDKEQVSSPSSLTRGVLATQTAMLAWTPRPERRGALSAPLGRAWGLRFPAHDSTLGESSREAQSGRHLLGTNGGSLWLWCCLAQPGALGP